VTNEDKTEDQLPQPGLGDRQPVQQFWRHHGRLEGQFEAKVGAVELLVDELAADVLAGGNLGDGNAGKGVEGQLLASRPRQGGGAAGVG
jgi:hypothetical protein